MQLAKYTTAISLFASSALAQWVAIVVPTPGTTITPGSTITVQIGTNVSAVSVFWGFDLTPLSVLDIC
jgi:hypothetical protein